MMSTVTIHANLAKNPVRPAEQHRADERQHRANELLDAMREALDRRRWSRAQAIGVDLSRLGYQIRQVPGTTGITLIPPPRDHATADPDEDPGRMPVLWFARLDRARLECDAALERRALGELRRLGYLISYDNKEARP